MSGDGDFSVPAPAGSELATIREVMQTDLARYWADDGMQARHLALLEVERGEKASAPGLTAVDRELAQIRHVMRTDYWGYWKNEALQERHRELLEAKERGDTGGSDAAVDPGRHAGLRTVTEVRREVEANGDWENFE